MTRRTQAPGGREANAVAISPPSTLAAQREEDSAGGVVTRRRFVTCRFSEAQFERLDALAGARGLSRSAVIRALVDEASPDEVAPAIPDEDEVMRLLSERARAGNVSALKAVLAWHEHRRREQPAEPAGEDRMAVLEAVA